MPDVTSVLDLLVYVKVATPSEQVRDGCPCFYYDGLAKIEDVLGPKFPIASDGFGSVWVRQTAEHWQYVFAYGEEVKQ